MPARAAGCRRRSRCRRRGTRGAARYQSSCGKRMRVAPVDEEDVDRDRPASWPAPRATIRRGASPRRCRPHARRTTATTASPSAGPRKTAVCSAATAAKTIVDAPHPVSRVTLPAAWAWMNSRQSRVADHTPAGAEGCAFGGSRRISARSGSPACARGEISSGGHPVDIGRFGVAFLEPSRPISPTRSVTCVEHRAVRVGPARTCVKIVGLPCRSPALCNAPRERSSPSWLLVAASCSSRPWRRPEPPRRRWRPKRPAHGARRRESRRSARSSRAGPTTVDAATARRDGVRSRLDTARQQEEALARTRTSELGEIERRPRRASRSHEARVARFAAAAYRDGPSVTPLTQLFSSDSAGDYAYRHEIVRRVGAQQRHLVKDGEAHPRSRPPRRTRQRATERDRLTALASSLERDLPAREAGGHGRSDLPGPGPVLAGPVGGDPSADRRPRSWVRPGSAPTSSPPGSPRPAIGRARPCRSPSSRPSTSRKAASTERPQRHRVRPVDARDRRDSRTRRAGRCSAPTTTSPAWVRATAAATGNRFPDAAHRRAGADAAAPGLRRREPDELRRSTRRRSTRSSTRHFLKGKVTTWAGLTGTWATARTYGVRILAIYEQILGWLTDRADI